MTDEDIVIDAEGYAENLAVQLRKGFLAYCVLKVCSHESVYTLSLIHI